MSDMKYLETIAAKMRFNLISMLSFAGSGHPGGSLSLVEILTALYYGKIMNTGDNPCAPDRDRLILSKGHASPALYVILADLGYFPKEWLRRFDSSGSELPKHCDRFKTPGIEASTGALGQGISIAVGMALAEKLNKTNHYDIYCIVGDGECQSGELWEALMSASKYRLDHLKIILDNNGLQIDGRTDDVMPLGDIKQKFEAFGCNVFECDGHNLKDLTDNLNKMKAARGKPQLLIANTVKGKGVSFMENNVDWHSDKINKQQAKQALGELKNTLDPEAYPVADFLTSTELHELMG